MNEPHCKDFKICGKIKQYRILSFNSCIKIHTYNVFEKGINKILFDKFASCINSCLIGFSKRDINQIMKKTNCIIIWSTNLTKFNNFKNRIILKKKTNETLAGVMILLKKKIPEIKNVYYLELVLFGVYGELRGRGIGSMMLKYLFKEFNNTLIILHPDCTSIQFYFKNSFQYWKNLYSKINDFYLFLYLNKNHNYQKIFDKIIKNMYGEKDCLLQLGAYRKNFSKVLLFHTKYRQIGSVLFEYNQYLDHISTLNILKDFLNEKIKLNFLPSNLLFCARELILKNKNKMFNFINYLKPKLLSYISNKYTSLCFEEKKNNILIEISENFKLYKKYYFYRKINNINKEKNNVIKFVTYIYINRIIYYYNVFFKNKIDYFFDKKLKKFYKKQNMITKIYKKINNYFGILNELLNNRTKLREVNQTKKIKENIKRLNTSINYLKFIKLFEILQSCSKTHQYICDLLKKYRGDNINVLIIEKCDTRFDLYLYINRILHYYNNSFNRSINYFIDKRRKYNSEIMVILNEIENIKLNHMKINYKTFLNRLIK
jgi:ribosomal protein S18 acetylase RimI-like enzyme